MSQDVAKVFCAPAVNNENKNRFKLRKTVKILSFHGLHCGQTCGGVVKAVVIVAVVRWKVNCSSKYGKGGE